MRRAFLSFALPALMAGFASTPLTAQQEPADRRSIEVAGTGEVQAAPDVATVMFAVETEGETAEEAGQANAARMETVLDALVASGLSRDDIETRGYSVRPEYDRRQPQDTIARSPTIVGYRAVNRVSVETVDLDGVGALIDLGIEAGANRMEGVGFELRDADAAYAEALEQAVGQARAAAETLATALGVTLGEVMHASTSVDRPRFQMMARDMAMAEDAATTPIEPGEQAVSARVTLRYAIDN